MKPLPESEWSTLDRKSGDYFCEYRDYYSGTIKVKRIAASLGRMYGGPYRVWFCKHCHSHHTTSEDKEPTFSFVPKGKWLNHILTRRGTAAWITWNAANSGDGD